MTLDEARGQIERTFEAMRRAYGEAVFDEWAIIALGNSAWTLVSYSGPRRDTFSGALPVDLKPLADTTTMKTHAIGDFEFAPNAPGTRHDVMLRLGESTYLLGNNTKKGMAEIRSTQRWLKAQPFFAALSQTFQNDPLIVPPTRSSRAPGER